MQEQKFMISVEEACSNTELAMANAKAEATIEEILLKEQDLKNLRSIAEKTKAAAESAKIAAEAAKKVAEAINIAAEAAEKEVKTARLFVNDLYLKSLNNLKSAVKMNIENDKSLIETKVTMEDISNDIKKYINQAPNDKKNLLRQLDKLLEDTKTYSKEDASDQYDDQLIEYCIVHVTNNNNMNSSEQLALCCNLSKAFKKYFKMQLQTQSFIKASTSMQFTSDNAELPYGSGNNHHSHR